MSFTALVAASATFYYFEYGAFGLISYDGTRITKSNVTIRDFKAEHPEFESGKIVSEKGIVLPTLGPDKKPQYNENTTSITTNGKEFFEQWYNDRDGVNMEKNATLTLTELPDNPRLSVFSDSEFFPIDDELFGNEGYEHNYHFTTEIHSQFRYQGGEKLKFTGDDDLWVFLNNKLIIDLGGVHPAETQIADLDALASTIGIAPGNTYNIDIFQAERQTTASTFSLTY
jgi:fibro-slime domain-containing protein